MTRTARAAAPDTPVPADLLDSTRRACEATGELLALARTGLLARLGGGRVSGAALETHQSAAHALAWLATCSESLAQLHAWAERLAALRPLRRDGAVDPPDRLRGIPIPDRRRHPDVAGRDRPPRRSRPRPGGSRPARPRRDPDAGGQFRRRPRPPRRADGREGRRRQLRRHRPRRRGRDDPRHVPPLRRREDRPPRPRLAPARTS